MRVKLELIDQLRSLSRFRTGAPFCSKRQDEQKKLLSFCQLVVVGEHALTLILSRAKKTGMNYAQYLVILLPWTMACIAMLNLPEGSIPKMLSDQSTPLVTPRTASHDKLENQPSTGSYINPFAHAVFSLLKKHVLVWFHQITAGSVIKSSVFFVTSS